MDTIFNNYFVTDINEESFALLVGSGFTKAYQTKEFDYVNFSNKVYSEIKEEVEGLKGFVFYDSIFRSDEARLRKMLKVLADSSLDNNIGFNVEELLAGLENLKRISSGIETEENMEKIEGIIKRINTHFKKEFEEYEKGERSYKGYKLNEAIKTVYSTNYVPDFNFLLEKDKLPANLINAYTNDLILRDGCKDRKHSNCLGCYKANKEICDLYEVPTLLYLHGGYSVCVDDLGEGKYRSFINDKLDARMHIVSGGTAETKLGQIEAHEYTSQAYNIFKADKTSIFVVGNSLSENDSHITQQISERLEGGNKLYYEVYANSESEYKNKVADILLKFDTSYHNQIKFVKTEHTPSILFKKV